MNSSQNTISITEFHAAQDVPGSKLLIQGPANILIDCGYAFARASNEGFPFNPTSIDAFILTHAHRDHGGREIDLDKAGFKGLKYTTRQTYDLQQMQNKQLVSSAHIHNRWAHKQNAKYGRGTAKRKPILYNYQDIKNARAKYYCEDEGTPGVSYNKPTRIHKNITATFYEAGHMPGSAQVLLDIKHHKAHKKILYTGDLGRTDYPLAGQLITDMPIFKFPEKKLPKDIDALVIEATNGGRTRSTSLQEGIDIYTEAIHDAYKHKGRVILPIFSMRTPMLWHINFDLIQKGLIPKQFTFNSANPNAKKNREKQHETQRQP